MGLGEELRRARMSKKLTASQVAAETRMKKQVVEALESEDFSTIAAPIYAKGFIKMYAEYVDLKPEPLIEDYLQRFAPKASTARPLATDAGDADAPEPEPEPEPEPDLFEAPSRPQEVRRARAPKPTREHGARDMAFDASLRRLRSMASEAGQGVRRCCDRFGDGCSEAAQGIRAGLKQGRLNLAETLRARRRELAQIDFTTITSRHVVALLALLILVLFTVSSLTRCLRMIGSSSAESETVGEALMPLATEPPDSYIEP